MNNSTPFCPNMYSRQHGFVLVMSMLFLLLLTIIGITSLSTTSLEEKMAHNVKDKNLSAQSAESALALAESWLDSYGTTSRVATNLLITQNPSATDGITMVVTDTDPPIWRDPNLWKASAGDFLDYPNVPVGTPGPDLSHKLFAAQPRYVIENLKKTGLCDNAELDGSRPEGGESPPRCHKLYITARGVGGTTAAVTLSQSTYNQRAD